MHGCCWSVPSHCKAPAGKTLTKQLMVAVESALQDRFGSHAGWAHNTLFISELASQQHVLPAHLHPGFRGKAPRKARAPDEETQADMAIPVTPPQRLGRGQRSTARSAGTKRRAAELAAVKQEQDMTGITLMDQPGAGCAPQPAVEQSAMSHGDLEPSIKPEQVQGSEAVSEALEGAAMDAFAMVRQVDAGAQAEVGNAVRHAEQQLTGAGTGNRRGRKVARKVAQPHSADAGTADSAQFS